MDVTETVKGGSVLGGDFRVSFRGATTPNIPVTATASDMKRALENLPSIGHVSVTLIPGTALTGGVEWKVTFNTEAGDLPKMQVRGCWGCIVVGIALAGLVILMSFGGIAAHGSRVFSSFFFLVHLFQVTNGRLTGRSPAITVITRIEGSPATLVYDGTDAPNVRTAVVTGLTPDNTYAFRVAALSAVGDGLVSTASVTVVASAGASAAHTTAHGASLTTGFAGIIHEVQRVVVAGAALAGGTYTLALGTTGQVSGALQFGATDFTIKAALEVSSLCFLFLTFLCGPVALCPVQSLIVSLSAPLLCAVCGLPGLALQQQPADGWHRVRHPRGVIHRCWLHPDDHLRHQPGRPAPAGGGRERRDPPYHRHRCGHRVYQGLCQLVHRGAPEGQRRACQGRHCGDADAPPP